VSFGFAAMQVVGTKVVLKANMGYIELIDSQ
jgi:hypothetical protein